MSGQKAALHYGIYTHGTLLPSWAEAVLAHVRQEGIAQLDYHFQEIQGRLRCVRLLDQQEVSPTEARPDFVLSLAPELPSPDVAQAMASRVWFYRFGQELNWKNFGKLELLNRSVFQVIFLEELNRTERQILRSGNFRSRHHSLAYHRHALSALSADWVAAAARVLASGHSLNPRPTPALESFSYPSWVGARLLWRQLKGQWRMNVDRLVRQFVYRQWSVGQVNAPVHEVALGKRLSEVKWWPEPKSPMCLADPQPIRLGEKSYLLAESFSYVRQHGRIVSFDLAAPTPGVAPSLSCRATQHISYPCVCYDEATQQNYAVFEDLSMTDVLILRAGTLPNSWSAVGHIEAPFPVSDPTLFCHRGNWWLFATRFSEHSPGNTALYAWYSESGPKGPWKPHLRNPIKVDVASARGAGPVFSHAGELYRPSQNCAEVYGESIIINRIAELTPTEFTEVQQRELLPHSLRPKGIHHISGLGDLTFVDGRKDRFSWAVGIEKVELLARRFLTKAFHYCYFQSWRFGLWTPQDRRFMTRELLPYFQALGPKARILFVGVYDYTRTYAESFAPGSFVTLDWDPGVARFGADEHHVADIATFQGGPYDAVILNGVVGFGLNHQHHIRRALRNLQGLLVPDGWLVVGTTVEKFETSSELLEEYFRSAPFPPTGRAAHRFNFPLTNVQHEYRFLRARQRGTQRTPYENYAKDSDDAPTELGLQWAEIDAGTTHRSTDR